MPPPPFLGRPAALGCGTAVPRGGERTAIPPLPEGVSCAERAGGVLAFTYDASKMGAGAVLDAIRAGGMRLMDVKTEEADLEDVFLQLTSKAGEPVSAA